MLSTQKTRDNDRAVVLVMVLGILAAMTVVATAFVVFMNQSYKAAANTQFAAQAEIAARSGLERAIRVIRFSKDKLANGDWKAITPDGVLMPDGSPVDFVDTEDPDNTEPDAGWHRYFEWDPTVSPDFEQLSDPANWVAHYHADANSDNVNDEKYGAELFGAAQATEHLMCGRVFDIHYPVNPATTRGQYAVCVVDLDGKLHANLTSWPEDQHGYPWGLVQAVARDVCGLETYEFTSLTGAPGSVAGGYSSVGEVARRANIRFGPTDSPAGTAPMGKYRIEKHFTVYPLVRSDYRESSTPDGSDTVITLKLGGLEPDFYVGGYVAFANGGGRYKIMANDASTVKVEGDCTVEAENRITIVTPRPAVNINTAPEALIRELLKCAYSLKHFDPEGPEKAAALAKYLCSRRPFANRHEFEEAVRRVTGDDAIDDLPGIDFNPNDHYANHLSENQFNDVLNNAAGVLGDDGGAFDKDDSAYDIPNDPGLYQFDGWKYPSESSWEGPSQTGGTGSGGLKGTWSTEFKFTSRFFHIYVLGRGWNREARNPDPSIIGRPQGVARLHAIYDAEADRVLWLRWNLSSRGSVADIRQ